MPEFMTVGSYFIALNKLITDFIYIANAKAQIYFKLSLLSSIEQQWSFGKVSSSQSEVHGFVSHFRDSLFLHFTLN